MSNLRPGWLKDQIDQIKYEEQVREAAKASGFDKWPLWKQEIFYNMLTEFEKRRGKPAEPEDIFKEDMFEI